MSTQSSHPGNGGPVSTTGALGGAPPHSLEAEQSVLGAILLSERSITQVVIEEGLRPEDFYRRRHGVVFEAMLALYAENEPIDVLTVNDRLRAHSNLDEAGGNSAVDSLTGGVPVAGNARRYARIVKEQALLRGALTATYEIQAKVTERDGAPRDIVEWAERRMLDVAHDDRQKDFKSIEDVLFTELDKLERLSREGTALTGTPSGFKALDDITGGFQPGNLVIIAARPSMGKSALVTNIAENVALDHGKAVALFSLEMSEAELAQRFLASQADVPGDHLRKGRVKPGKWSSVVGASRRLAAAPLWVDDSSDVGLLEVRAKARRLHQQHELGLIIIDYLQLLRPDGSQDSRVLQIGEMSRGLKILAGELQVPVIALSQLSRAVESRTDKHPMLSDLRESGCVTGDTPVYLADSGSRASIRDLVGRDDVEVLALDPDTWTLERRRVRKAFCTGTKPVFRLTLASGRTVRATGNHRFLTIEGWRRLDELDTDTHLATPRALPAGGRATMTEDELALLGHLIGDGCVLPRHAVQYTTVERELASHVCDLARRVFGDGVLPRIRNERSWLQVYLPSARRLTHGVRNPVTTWFEELGIFGLRSHEKRVPDRVFEQPAEGIAAFLRHLWATDGSVWAENGGSRVRVYYATSSRRLADDVQSLLLRLGIMSTKSEVGQRGRGRSQWHVQVRNRDAVLGFLRTVGTRRTAVAAEILHRVEPLAAHAGSDVIPRTAWRTLVQPAMASAGTTTRALHAAIDTQYCGSTLYRSNIGRVRARRVAEAVACEPLRRLAASDVSWDRVRSIEPDGIEEVFDLEVDGLHNFVAGDIVAHNSIEQDSDLVMFIYRDEYYDPETERQGEADLIIAKHRSGGLGTVPLVFQKDFPRFRTMLHDPERHG